MDPSSAEEALRNVVILDEVFEFLTLKQLKIIRLVNSTWNEVAAGKLRKRSSVKHSSLKSFRLFLRYEARFPNPDLTVKLLGEVTVKNFASERPLLFRALRFKLSWLHRIKDVYLCYWSKAELNRLIPSLLQNLPGLQGLKIDCMYHMSERKKTPLPLYITDVASPSTVQFPLKSLKITFDENDWNRHPLRPNFLLYCNQLKDFEVDFGGDSRQAFVEFFRLWKEIQLPTMQYENVKLNLIRLSTRISAEDLDDFFLETIVDFLNRSNTRALSIAFYSHLSSQVVRNHAALLPNIRKLTLDSFSFEIERWEARGVSIGEVFHNCIGFSGLRELCLEVDAVQAELKRRKEIIQQDRSVRGYFADVAVLEGLQKLKLIVDSTPVSEATALVAFFHGYVPHVLLEMDLTPSSWDGSALGNKPAHKLRLSVQEFTEALDDAVASMDVDNLEDESGDDSEEGVGVMTGDEDDSDDLDEDDGDFIDDGAIGGRHDPDDEDSSEESDDEDSSEESDDEENSEDDDEEMNNEDDDDYIVEDDDGEHD